jgi:hypothetical protein
MKQYTTKEQTQHLIELGLPKPQSITYGDNYGEMIYQYSIGELISFLESYVVDSTDELLIWKDSIFWYTRLTSDSMGSGCDVDLINALYNYLVELKEYEAEHE